MEGNGRQSAKEKKEKPAKSWAELYDRMLRELGIHPGFRSGGD